jgi:hypothetical protein
LLVVFAQIAFERGQHQLHAGTVFVNFGHPFGRDVFERVSVVDLQGIRRSVIRSKGGESTLKQSIITCVSSYESARRRSNSSWPAVSHRDSSMWTLSTKMSCLSAMYAYLGECISYHERNSLNDTSISILSRKQSQERVLTKHRRFTTQEKTPRLTQNPARNTIHKLTKPSGKTCIVSISIYRYTPRTNSRTHPLVNTFKAEVFPQAPSPLPRISRIHNNKAKRKKSSQQNHLPLDDLLAPA